MAQYWIEAKTAEEIEAIESVRQSVRICWVQESGDVWLEIASKGTAATGDKPRIYLFGYRVGKGSAKDKKYSRIQTRPPGQMSQMWVTSEFDRVEHIKIFRNAIFTAWEKAVEFTSDENKLKTLSKGTSASHDYSPASFVAKALKTGFDAIGKGFKLGSRAGDISLSDLQNYARERSKISPWRDHKAGLADEANGSYAAFLELPPVERQDDQDPPVGVKIMKWNSEIQCIPCTKAIGHSKKFAYPELEQAFGGDYPRVITYGFRGDTRSPQDLQMNFSGAFTPNYARATQALKVNTAFAKIIIADTSTHLKDLADYIKTKFNEGKSVRRMPVNQTVDPGIFRKLADLKPWNSDSLVAIMNFPAYFFPLAVAFGGLKDSELSIKDFWTLYQDAFNLNLYIDEEFFGAFVSVSRSALVARSFACGRGGTTPRGDGWVYAVFAEGAFFIPFTKTGEFELAVAGMTEWQDVVGFRKVLQNGKFDGAVYLRRSLRHYDPGAFNELYDLLCGKRQSTF